MHLFNHDINGLMYNHNSDVILLGQGYMHLFNRIINGL